MTKFIRATFHNDYAVAEFVASHGDRLLRSGGTFSWRINNPGNLRPPRKHQITSHIGVARTSNGEFLIFPDYPTGRSELERLLRERYGARTITETVNKFAPATENDSGKYLQLLCQRASVSRDAIISTLARHEFEQLVDAIEHIEGFRHKSATRVERWIQASSVSLADGAAPLRNQPVIIRRGGSEVLARTDAHGQLGLFIHSAANELVELYNSGLDGAREKIGTFVASGPSTAYTFFSSFIEVQGRAKPHAGVGSPRLTRPAFRYRVQPGDTLGRIARKFNVAVDRLVKNNRARLKSVDRIYPEQILYIGGADQSAFPPRQAPESTPPGGSISDNGMTRPRPNSRDITATAARSREGQGRPLALLPSEQRRAPWMEIAIREATQWAGLAETAIDDSRNYHAELGIAGTWKSRSGTTHDFRSMDNDTGSPWCASFANYCLKMSDSPYVKSASSQFPILNPGRFSRIDKPVYGALVVWRKGGEGHVAFVYGRDADTADVIALGGNQADRITFMLESETTKSLVGYFVPTTYLKFAQNDAELTPYDIAALNRWIKYTAYKRRTPVNDR